MQSSYKKYISATGSLLKLDNDYSMLRSKRDSALLLIDEIVALVNTNSKLLSDQPSDFSSAKNSMKNIATGDVDIDRLLNVKNNISNEIKQCLFRLDSEKIKLCAWIEGLSKYNNESMASGSANLSKLVISTKSLISGKKYISDHERSEITTSFIEKFASIASESISNYAQFLSTDNIIIDIRSLDQKIANLSQLTTDIFPKIILCNQFVSDPESSVKQCKIIFDQILTSSTSIVKSIINLVDVEVERYVFVGESALDDKKHYVSYRDDLKSHINSIDRTYNINNTISAAKVLSNILTVTSRLSGFFSGIRKNKHYTLCIEPVVIVSNQNCAVGLSYNGKNFIFNGTSGNNSGRKILLCVQVGVLQIDQFRIELHKETKRADWVRWMSGGFLTRKKPEFEGPIDSKNGFQFLIQNIIPLWTGETPLSEIAELVSVSAQKKTSRKELEEFFSEL